jgi:serine/threonine protein kinase
LEESTDVETRRNTHPSPDVLQAFGLGKLGDAEAETVLDHLETCSDCRKEVAAQSGDTFLDHLRQAHRPSNTPAPGGSLSDLARRLRAGSAPTAPYVSSSVAPELASHPQYEILRELGRGGMGVVYLARNRLMARLEVLKVVNKDMLERSGGKERFLREIQSAAMLNHPNVVAAYSALPVGDLLVFAMEYIEGEDLAKVVKERGPLPVLNACYYVQQAAMGLQHAFEKNMVHRDIKPQNLILGKKHVIKVLDFGLAKVLQEKTDDTGLTGLGRMLGTPDYIAPEQTLDATSADTRADIYSLGCTLYFLLTGHAPFRAKSLYEILQAHQTTEAKPLNLERPEVPVELATVVAKMMAKEPAKRYQKPVEVAQALMPFIKPGTKSAPTAAPSHEMSLGEATAAKPLGKAARPAPAPAPSARSPLEAAKPARPVAEPPSPVQWDMLTTSSALMKSRRSGATWKRGSTGVKLAVSKNWLIGSGAVCVLLIGLVVLWAAGVFVKVQTKDGTIVVEVNEPNADVFVDGAKMTVVWGDGGKKAEVRVKPGTHKVQVTKDGFTADGEKVTLTEGGRQILAAKIDRLPAPPVAPAKESDSVVEKPGRAPVGKPLVPAAAAPNQIPPAGPGRRALWASGFTWTVEGDELIKEGLGRGYVAFGDPGWSDYDLNLEARKSDGPDGLGVLFRCSDGKLYCLVLGALGNTHNFNIWSRSPKIDRIIQQTPGTIRTHEWYKVKISLRGQHIRIELDDHLLFACQDNFVQKGSLSLAWYNSAGRFRKIKVTAPDGTVLWEGPPDLPGQGAKTTAVGASPVGQGTETPRLPPSSSTADGVLPLFNGKDLEGWEGLQEYWSVKGGALVGSTFPQGVKFNTFLCSKKKFRDFELSFKVRLTGKGWSGNSGVQIRSRIFDFGRFAVEGPQCDMGDIYWGSLYGEHFGGMMKQAPAEVVKRVLRVDDFNDYSIKCSGKHVIIKLNAETVVDDDFENLPDEGIIAWQLHTGTLRASCHCSTART